MSVDLFSQAFSLVADQLEALRDDPKLSPRDRNRFLRFAPFLRQLGKRPKFYKDLARDEYSAMSLDLTFDEIVSLFAPLLERYGFPSKEPFRFADWAGLLGQVHLTARGGQLKPFLLGSWPEAFQGQTIELQFVFYGTSGQLSKSTSELPVIGAKLIHIPPGRSKKQVHDNLKRQMLEPLRAFLLKVRPLLKSFPDRGPFRPGFEVRVTPLKSPFPRLGREEHTVRAYHVALPARRRIEPILNEIIEALLKLNLIDELVTAQGRLPEATSAARWWAKANIDRRTVTEIARDEEPDPDMVINLEETIARTLRRL